MRIKGSRIDPKYNSEHVSVEKEYHVKQDINSLLKTGQISKEEADLFHRFDELAGQKDGWISYQELSLGETKYGSSLLATEKKLLPKLWQVMEWSPSSTVETQSLPNIETFIEDITSSHNNTTKAFDISSFAQPLQKTAKRLQQLQNHDQENGTISLHDVFSLNHEAHEHFTATEKNALSELQKEMRIRMSEEGSPVEITKQIHTGTKNFPLFETDKVTASYQTTTSIVNRLEGKDMMGGQRVVFSGFHLEQQTNFKFEIPAGHTANIISGSKTATLTEKESVLDFQDYALGNERRGGAGDFRMELYKDGELIESYDFHLPSYFDTRIDERGREKRIREKKIANLVLHHLVDGEGNEIDWRRN